MLLSPGELTQTRIRTRQNTVKERLVQMHAQGYVPVIIPQCGSREPERSTESSSGALS